MARIKKKPGPDKGDPREAMSTIILTDKDGNVVYDGTKDPAHDEAEENEDKDDHDDE